MSSTNRSNSRDYHISDYYVTPVNEIVNFLNNFFQYENIDKNYNILDPCAGGDKTHDMSYVKTLKNFGFNNINSIDIRDDSLANIKGDYLNIDCKRKYNVIITNPPFNISLDIIKKALSDVYFGGWVIMLLRLNYFGSIQRYNFWKQNMPKYTFVHHKRMSFTDNNKTDSIEYCHMVWQKGYSTTLTMLKVI